MIPIIFLCLIIVAMLIQIIRHFATMLKIEKLIVSTLRAYPEKVSRTLHEYNSAIRNIDRLFLDIFVDIDQTSSLGKKIWSIAKNDKFKTKVYFLKKAQKYE
mgnify:CR=1 FL=1